MFNRDLPAVRDDLEALAVSSAIDEGLRGKLITALSQASPVVRTVQAFDILKDGWADKSDEHKKALAGCAFLVSSNSWFGKGAEATEILSDVSLSMTPPPPPEPEVESPPPEPEPVTAAEG